MQKFNFLLILMVLSVLLFCSCGESCGDSCDPNDETDGDSSESDDATTDGDITESDDAETDGDIEDFEAIEDSEDAEENSSETGNIEGTAKLKTLEDSSEIDILLLMNEMVISQTETDQDGSYSFTDLEPGDYLITASWGDFTIERVVATEVKVLAQKTVTASDLSLTPTGKISGVATLNGATAGNLGIEVYLSGHSYVAKTGDEGNYLLSYVPVGTYQLCAEKDGYSLECNNSVEVIAGDTTAANKLDLSPNTVTPPDYSSLSGTITLIGEDDHSGITVSLNGTNLKTTTNADGNYTMVNIPQGQYDIVFDAPDNSGFEQGATLYQYRLFGGIPETLPELQLQLGQNASENVLANLSESTVSIDDKLGHIWVHNSDKHQLLKYTSETNDLEIIDDNLSKGIHTNTDKDHIVYYTDDKEIYSVATNSTTPVLLGDNTKDSFQICSSYDKVIFRDYTNSQSIYSVPINGGTPVLLFDNAKSTCKTTPDCKKLLCILSNNELHSISTDGGSSAKIAGSILNFIISPDASKLVYTDGNKLFSSSFTGTNTTMLMESFDSLNSSFAISENSNYVIIFLEYGHSSGYMSMDGNESAILSTTPIQTWMIKNSDKLLYWNHSDTEPSIRLIDLSTNIRTTLAENIRNLALSPNEEKVVYIKNGALYSININGGTPVNCYDEEPINYFEITPDSQRIIFQTDSTLYSVPINGDNKSQLGTLMSYIDFKVSPDSNYVIYYDFGNNELHRVSITGGNNQIISILSDRNDYFPAFDSFDTVLYLRRFMCETTYYSGSSYRFNGANFY